MAALLQQHGAALVGAAPVAPHKAVGLVPVAHVLDGLHGHHLPHGAAVQQFLYLFIKGGVAQHVAHHHPAAGLAGDAGQQVALLQTGRDRLFQQQVIALLQRGHGLGHMLPVHGGDDRGVRQTGPGQQLLPGPEALLRGKAQQLCHLVPLFVHWLGDGGDAHLAAEFQEFRQIGVLAPVAQADQRNGE